MPELATAWITLSATTRGMERDIRRALDRVEDSSSGKLNVQVDTSRLGREGDRAGREFARRFESSSDNARPGNSFGSNFGKLAGGAFLGGFAASLAGGALAGLARSAADEFKNIFETGLDFSKTLNNFQGVTRATSAEMAQMQATARSLGSDTTLAGASSSDAALAMTELAKAGFSVDQAMTAARGTLELATAGQIDAAQAAEIQSNAMNAFSLDATNAAHVADLLANAAVASSADIPDIGMALSQVGGIAHGFGENLDDTVAALGMFANAGVKGSDAGTLLKTTMQSITDQGNPAQGAIHELGLELYKLNGQGQNQFVGFRELFRQLDEARKRINDPEIFQAQTNILFGSDAMRSAMLGNADAFDKMLKSVQHVGGASELAGAQMKGLPGAVEAFKNTVEGIRLDVFDKFGPALAGPLTEFIQYLSDHKDEVVQFFVTMGGAALTMAKVVASSIRDTAGVLGDLAGAVGMDDFAQSLHFVEDAAGQAVTGIGQAENALAKFGERAAQAKQFTDYLGGSVKSLKLVGNDATIDVKDNTPEVQQRLQAMGAHLVQLGNDPTRLKIVADTDEANTKINGWRQTQGGQPLTLKGDVDMAPGRVSIGNFFASLPPQKIKGQVEVSGIGTTGGGVSGGNPVMPARDARGVIIPPPRAAGGLFSAMPSAATIQPATPGLIQWAEPSTKGEAFIPLGGGARSKAIWAQTGHLLGAFDQGGYTGVDAALLSRVPAGRYDASGDLAQGLGDCSSAVEDLVNILDGAPTAGRGMNTGNASEWLTAHGFVPGSAPGAFNVGYNGEHMQATLPDGTPFNWGSDAAAARGGVGGSGASDPSFTSHFYRPVPGMTSYDSSMGGYDAPDPRQLREAQEKVADADARLAIQQKQLDELKADASESQRMQQKADVDKARREADDARADLAEVQRGKPRKGKGGSSDGMDGSSLGESIFGGILQGMGLDGSVFSNPFEWPNVKSAMALANFGGGLLQGAMGVDPSAGGGGGGGGGFSIPGLSGFDGLLKPMAAGALAPNGASSDHIGTGAAPGPANVYNYNGPIGMRDMAAQRKADDAHANQAYRQSLSAPRPI